MFQSNTAPSSKEGLREYALARRRHAIRQAGPATAVRGAEHFLAAIRIPQGAIVSGYVPVKEEFDVMPLLGKLSRSGIQCCLPIIKKRMSPLLFRVWQPGAKLVRNPYRIPEPESRAAEISPNILLVPLLAFDSDGYRLGYGGGYYDRTLSQLRETDSQPLAIGMAFTEQQVQRVPRDESDERLDWVVTERGAMPITPAGERTRA